MIRRRPADYSAQIALDFCNQQIRDLNRELRGERAEHRAEDPNGVWPTPGRIHYLNGKIAGLVQVRRALNGESPIREHSAAVEEPAPPTPPEQLPDLFGVLIGEDRIQAWVGGEPGRCGTITHTFPQLYQVVWDGEGGVGTIFHRSLMREAPAEPEPVKSIPVFVVQPGTDPPLVPPTFCRGCSKNNPVAPGLKVCSDCDLRMQEGQIRSSSFGESAIARDAGR